MPPGQTLVLVVGDAAVWGVCANLDPVGREQFRCTIFRNETARLSSELIVEATRASSAWALEHGIIAPLTTEIDPRRVRHKRDPGRCFRKAGWFVIGVSKSHRHRGAIVMQGPLVIA